MLSAERPEQFLQLLDIPSGAEITIPKSAFIALAHPGEVLIQLAIEMLPLPLPHRHPKGRDDVIRLMCHRCRHN